MGPHLRRISARAALASSLLIMAGCSRHDAEQVRLAALAAEADRQAAEEAARQQRIANQFVADQVRRAETALHFGKTDEAVRLLGQALGRAEATELQTARQLLATAAARLVAETTASAAALADQQRFDEAERALKKVLALGDVADLGGPRAMLTDVEQRRAAHEGARLLAQARERIAAGKLAEGRRLLAELLADHRTGDRAPLVQMLRAIDVALSAEGALAVLGAMPDDEFLVVEQALAAGQLPHTVRVDDPALADRVRSSLSQQLASARQWRIDEAARKRDREAAELAAALGRQIEEQLGQVARHRQALSVAVFLDPYEPSAPPGDAAGDDDAAGQWLVWVQWRLAAGNDQLATRAFARDDVRRILRALRASSLDYEAVYLFAVLPIQSGQPAAEEEFVVNAVYPRQRVAMVDLDTPTFDIYEAATLGIIRHDFR